MDLHIDSSEKEIFRVLAKFKKTKSNTQELLASQVKKVLDKDVDHSGHTLLHGAIKKGHTKIVEMILEEAHANKGDKFKEYINAKDEIGATPLYLAVLNNNELVAKMLLANGVDTNIENENGDTPLHLAILKNRKWAINILLANGANVDIQNKAKNTPLHMAIMYGNTSAIKALIGKKADPNIPNKHGHTAFDIARRKNNPLIMRILLAIMYGNIFATKALIGKKENPNTYRRTTLDIVRQRNNSLVIKRLSGETPYVVDNIPTASETLDQKPLQPLVVEDEVSKEKAMNAKLATHFTSSTLGKKKRKSHLVAKTKKHIKNHKSSTRSV